MSKKDHKAFYEPMDMTLELRCEDCDEERREECDGMSPTQDRDVFLEEAIADGWGVVNDRVLCGVCHQDALEEGGDGEGRRMTPRIWCCGLYYEPSDYLCRLCGNKLPDPSAAPTPAPAFVPDVITGRCHRCGADLWSEDAGACLDCEEDDHAYTDDIEDLDGPEDLDDNDRDYPAPSLRGDLCLLMDLED